MLGLFMQPTYNVCKRPHICGLPTPQFFPLPDEGKELTQGILDASLSFIGRTVYLKASSGGFLLCCYELDNEEHYCICNPVTRQWRDLARASRTFSYVALAFSCSTSGGDESTYSTSIDQVHFTVIRAEVANFRRVSTSLEIETFSSEAGEWRECTVVCDRPFGLVGSCEPAFEIDQVKYWRVNCPSCLLAYHPTSDRLEQIEPPQDGGGFIAYSDLWGQSGGRILYARHDREHLELWALQSRSDEWDLVARESLATMFELTPRQMSRRGKDNFIFLGIKGIHPQDSRKLILVWNHAVYCCNVVTRKLEKVAGSSVAGVLKKPMHYFFYELPSPVGRLRPVSKNIGNALLQQEICPEQVAIKINTPASTSTGGTEEARKSAYSILPHSFDYAN